MIKKICVLVIYQHIIKQDKFVNDYTWQKYMALYRNKKHISIIKRCFIKA